MTHLDPAYQRVHRAVGAAKGDAKRQSCISCGGPAFEWAYQHTAVNPLIDGNGFVYSEDLEDYAPMCRRCHRTLDHQHMSAEARISKTFAMRDRLAELHQEDPTFNMPTRSCDECGLTTNAPAIGMHQKGTGHRGWSAA